MVKRPAFDFIEKQIRKKSFGVISTVTPKGHAHSTGIIYGVSLPEKKFALYSISNEMYKKVRNIKKNPHISFVVPFPHDDQMIPQNVVQFQAQAEILPIDNPEAQDVFHQNEGLKRNLEPAGTVPGMIFIKMTPNQKIHVFGLGVSLREIEEDVLSAMYSVTIPKERL
jgi:general stress protein 26